MRPEPDEQLHAYLDGRLEDDERSAFLERVAQDPGLQRELETQEALRESLQRSFAPPDLRELTARVRASAVQAGARGSWRGRRLLAAAALLVLAGAAWLLRGSGDDGMDHFVKQEQPSRIEREASLRLGSEWAELYDYAAYAQKKEKELSPPVGCTSPGDLAAYLPPDLLVSGTTLGFKQSPDCTLLEGAALRKKSPAPILELALGGNGDRSAFVFLLEREDPRRPVLPEGSGLNLFRRELGDLALYELTPLDHPVGLPRFYLQKD